MLTHYFARGETVLYLDGRRVGNLPEQLRTRYLTLGGRLAPAGGQYRNWLFYRAGMNADEVHALATDSLLKSSLELYAPLDGRQRAAPDSLANLAQSTNVVVRVPSPRPSSPRSSTSVLNRWPPTNTNIPRPVRNDPSGNNRFSTRCLKDGSYVRLKDATLTSVAGATPTTCCFPYPSQKSIPTRW